MKGIKMIEKKISKNIMVKGKQSMGDRNNNERRKRKWMQNK